MLSHVYVVVFPLRLQSHFQHPVGQNRNDQQHKHYNDFLVFAQKSVRSERYSHSDIA